MARCDELPVIVCMCTVICETKVFLSVKDQQKPKRKVARRLLRTDTHVCGIESESGRASSLRVASAIQLVQVDVPFKRPCQATDPPAPRQVSRLSP
jgi:hypothetical protein